MILDKVPYFILTGIYFYFFFFLLIIFGYALFQFINKRIFKNSKNIGTLEKCCISLIMSISFFISISFIFIIFESFNFYTIYLPLIIFNLLYIGFIIYKIGKNKLIRENIRKKIKNRKEHIQKSILIIIFIFIIQLIIQGYLLFHQDSLIYIDPFLTFNKISGIIDSGAFSMLNWDIHYPPGFHIFFSGVLLGTPSQVFIYYFIKFGGFFLLNLYLIFGYFISYKFFKSYLKSIIFLLLSLSYFVFLLRTTVFLSSSFSNLLILLSFVLFLKENQIDLKIQAIIVINLSVSLFFINPISAIFYFLIIYTFFIFQMIKYSKHNKKLIITELKLIGGMMTLFILLFIPYIFFIYSYGFNLMDLFIKYYQIFLNNSYQNSNLKPQQYITNSYNLAFLMVSIHPLYFLDIIFNIIGVIFYWSIGILIIFTVIGFIKIHKLKINKKLDFFLKITFVFILGFICIGFIGQVLFSNSYIINVMLSRYIETYSPLVIVLTILGIIFVEKKLKGSLNNIKSNSKAKKTILKNGVSYLIICIIIFNLYLNIIKSINHNEYSFDDETIDAYLYIRNNLKTNYILLDYERYELFLLFHYQQRYFYSEFNNTSQFSEFEDFIILNSIEYIFLLRAKYNNTIFENFISSGNYTIEYYNSKYYLFKYSFLD